MTEYTELFNDISRLLKGADLNLIEFSFDKRKAKAKAVIYKPEGTGVDDCTRAHRLILARLEALYDNDDISLETASPGIDRVIVSPEEYAIFKKRGVIIQLIDDDIPIEGCIDSSDGKVLNVLDASGNIRSIEIDNIKKGKLDFSREGR